MLGWLPTEVRYLSICTWRTPPNPLFFSFFPKSSGDCPSIQHPHYKMAYKCSRQINWFMGDEIAWNLGCSQASFTCWSQNVPAAYLPIFPLRQLHEDVSTVQMSRTREMRHEEATGISKKSSNPHYDRALRMKDKCQQTKNTLQQIMHKNNSLLTIENGKYKDWTHWVDVVLKDSLSKVTAWLEHLCRDPHILLTRWANSPSQHLHIIDIFSLAKTIPYKGKRWSIFCFNKLESHRDR